MKINLGLESISVCDVADFCCGELKCADGLNIKIKNVCTDSRETDENSLFIVTVGERVDGHNYIGSAIERGCRCFLCQYVPNDIDADMCAFIVVPDSVSAISALAKGYRAAKKLDSIAITGSVGKTTTKELVASIIREKYITYGTDGNFNSVIGMPMSLMEAPEDTEMGIFEMGMSAMGEISSMSRCAEPCIAIVTNIGTSHLEYLKSRENICRAKLEIAEGLRAGGKLLLNADEPLLMGAREIVGRDDIEYIYISAKGNERTRYRAENIRISSQGSDFDLYADGKHICDIHINAVGEHIVFNAVLAYAAADIAGLCDEEIRRGLLKYKPAGDRQNIYKKGNITVIADCYNAAPESMRAALGVLSAIEGERKIAVLGDMKELGESSDSLHFALGEQVFSACDMLLTLGESAKMIAMGAKSAGLADENIFSFEPSMYDELASALNLTIHDGDAVLFKASRAMRLENIIEKLKI